jgi:hypothetical protein
VEELRAALTPDEMTRWAIFHARKAQRRELAHKTAG